MTVAVLVVGALTSACAGRGDVADSVSSSGHEPVPSWIRDGMDLAAAQTKPAAAPVAAPGAVQPSLAVAPTESPLPSRDTVVSALVSWGAPEQQATCVYDALSAKPEVAADAVTMLTASSSPGGAPVANLASVTSAGGLSSERSSAVLLTIAPCLAPAAARAAAAGGAAAAGSDPQSAAMVDGLLQTLSAGQIAALRRVDPRTLANTVGSALTPADRQRLEEAIAIGQSATYNSQAALSAISSLRGVDTSKLDLSKLTPDQAPLILLALVSGLTADQRAELRRLTDVSYKDLKLNVDPAKLAPEQLGGLLLLLSPVLATSLGSSASTPPPGVDPSQIYIPKGADLSSINPLLFLNRDDTIGELVNQGLAPGMAACLLDRFSRLSPKSLAAFFTSNPSAAVTSQFVLTAVSCIGAG